MAVVRDGDRPTNITTFTNIMTSLTRELNNPHSSLYKWFESRQSICCDRLIKSHNQKMDRTQIIRPLGHIEDFALLGTAFVYAFRWHIGLFNDNFNQTVASYNLSSTIAEQLLSAKTTEEKAIACLIFAAYEQKYRSGSIHEIATVLMNRSKNQLKPELNYVSTMINDLVNLINSISSVWDATNSSLTKRKYFLNPDFSGSYYINADAQQIVDGTLVKCFTTLKRCPFNRAHFWQQIAYVLMDWNDRYKINKICWYYSRQKALFIYPIKSLFKDLKGLRAEFKEFVLENYSDDEDEFDEHEFYAHWLFQ
ncbi:hypothetical protein IQ255_28010 [Pleurocapsales cyanobacterium LEGE 10410]|nr:hypothetical protein [Pleurocapsales cyanobacterium LEGE 10410]